MSTIELEVGQLISVTGEIYKIRNTNRILNGTHKFSVYARASKRFFEMSYEGFLMIREGDHIKCYCALTSTGIFEIKGKPNIIIPDEPDYVMKCFASALIYRKPKPKNIDLTTCRRLYEKLMAEGALEEYGNVTTYLTHLSEKWIETNHEDYLSHLVYVLENKEYALRLVTWWNTHYGLRRLYMLGITKDEISAIDMPLSAIYQRCISNPYTLPQISIEKCSQIDRCTRRKREDSDIICGLIVRSIYDNMTKKGWTCTSFNWIRKRHPKFVSMLELLKTEYYLVIDSIPNANPEKSDIEMAYLKFAYEAEKGVLEFLISHVRKGDEIMEPVAGLDKLDPQQLEAVTMAVNEGVSIITGGPGTGKSSTLDKVCANLTLMGKRYALTSFTGKAVARIKEVVHGSKPATMHKMVASPGKFNSPMFDVLIVDETSMITIGLFWKFIQIYGSKYSIVFVGDPGQLPPIGWGSLFNEIIKSRVIPKTVLRTNHRVNMTGGEDGILLNVNKIPRWQDGTPYIFEETSNFIMLDKDEGAIKDIVKQFQDSGLTSKQIQVLSPYNMNLNNINRLSQLIWTHGAPSITDPEGRIFNVGDRIYCMKNNYDADIMNGEEGIVISVDDVSIVGDFGEGRMPRIPFADPRKRKYASEDDDDEDKALTIKNICLSYALSVHKSQGSEYDYVIFALPRSAVNSGFLNRNLVYTGLSRAKSACIYLGDSLVLSYAVGQPLPYRCEYLSNRLQIALPILYEEEIKEELAVHLPADFDDFPSDDDWWD